MFIPECADLVDHAADKCVDQVEYNLHKRPRALQNRKDFVFVLGPEITDCGQYTARNLFGPVEEAYDLLAGLVYINARAFEQFSYNGILALQERDEVFNQQEYCQNCGGYAHHFEAGRGKQRGDGLYSLDDLVALPCGEDRGDGQRDQPEQVLRAADGIGQFLADILDDGYSLFDHTEHLYHRLRYGLGDAEFNIEFVQLIAKAVSYVGEAVGNGVIQPVVGFLDVVGGSKVGVFDILRRNLARRCKFGKFLAGNAHAVGNDVDRFWELFRKAVEGGFRHFPGCKNRTKQRLNRTNSISVASILLHLVYQLCKLCGLIYGEQIFVLLFKFDRIGCKVSIGCLAVVCGL